MNTAASTGSRWAMRRWTLSFPPSRAARARCRCRWPRCSRPASSRGKDHRTVGQKWDQIQAARDLEKKWTKPQILEAYLNLSTFRGEVQGVGAASRALFGVQPSGLDEQQSLILAVLLRGPNAQPALVAKRACALAHALDPPPVMRGLDHADRGGLGQRPELQAGSSAGSACGAPLVSRDARRVDFDAGCASCKPSRWTR